jgi:hypothetical protein
MMAGRAVKILVAYLSPSRTLIESDLSACFCGGLPALRAGDLNVKHLGWNSRLITRKGKLSHVYTNETSYLIYGPDTTTTIPFNPSATHDVLDIVITKDLASPVHPTSCPAMSLDHLPVLINMKCPSFFHPSDCPDFRHIDWATFQACLEDSILSYPELHDNRHVSLKINWHYSSALAGSILNSCTLMTHGP